MSKITGPSHNKRVSEYDDDSGDDSGSVTDKPRIAQWQDDPDEFFDTTGEATPSLWPRTRQNRGDTDQTAKYATSDDNLEQASRSSEANLSDDDIERRQNNKNSTEKQSRKRNNKHAPVEMTSKRPVSRKRKIVDTNPVQSRDPRFISLSGELRPDTFQSNYSFLNGLHKSELDTLKVSLKTAKKLLSNSSRELQEERRAEVERLERAVKRAESAVNKDYSEKIEREALDSIKKEEKEKRRQGKKNWYMKSSDKQEALIRARHDAMLSAGGSQAVKKAIEKRRKKVAQKEKRARPAGDIHFNGEGSSHSKRRRVV